MKLITILYLVFITLGCGKTVEEKSTNTQAGEFIVEEEHISNKVPDKFNKIYFCKNIRNVDPRLNTGKSVVVNYYFKNALTAPSQYNKDLKVVSTNTDSYGVQETFTGYTSEGDDFNGFSVKSELQFNQSKGQWTKTFAKGKPPVLDELTEVKELCDESEITGAKYGETKYYSGRYKLSSGQEIEAMKTISNVTYSTVTCIVKSNKGTVTKRRTYNNVNFVFETIKTDLLPNISENCKKELLFLKEVYSLGSRAPFKTSLIEILSFN